MCGIAGSLSLHGEHTPDGASGRIGRRRDRLRTMIGTLAHRGPDGSGVYVDADGSCGLAHARLSIIDLGGGHQPMSIARQHVDERESLAITFNGEIFNYVELRAELESKGRIFKTKSDTEVILHAYAVWGDRCVDKMNGQWAFAIWDSTQRRLFCARDRLGVRPFFYAEHDGQLVFASEPKALFAGGVSRALDVYGLHEIVTFWCARAPRTAWKGVHELPPGSTLVVDHVGTNDARVNVKRWWQLSYNDVDDALDHDDVCAAALYDALKAAAHIRLRADVPVGAYVSGGLDSSFIAALVAKTTDNALETFSITFDDPALDESQFQRNVVDALHTKHRALAITNGDVGAAFPELVRHIDTPIVRTAPTPMMLLAGLVRDAGYKVVLTGEGADEMLGGYDIFKEAKIRRFWARDPSSSIRPRLLRRLYPYQANLQAQPDAYLRAFFHVDERDVADPLFSHLPRFRLGQQLRALFSSDVRAAIAHHDPLEELRAELPSPFPEWDALAQAQYLESTILLPGYILSSQGDRAAMARSVEGRFPFLDANVIQLAARMPASQKMRVLDEKHALRRAAKAIVPASVLRRKKQPYRAPDAAAFFADDAHGDARRVWIADVLSTANVHASGVFDDVAVHKLVEKARRGAALSVRDNMAIVFVLSTLLLDAHT